MAVLAIHPGDLHLRAAYMGPLDAPAAVEDGTEPARFLTPSIATIDVGGALLGYSALMSCAFPRNDRVVWRYRRAALKDRGIVGRDAHERGLTSEAFIAFAASRLAAEARAYCSVMPEVALVVPDELDAPARTRLAAATTEATERPARVVGEDAALMAGITPLTDGDWLVASMDDDALRLRIVRCADGAVSRVAADELPQSGLGALRARWLAAWNAQAAALVPGARAFGEGDSYEFERMWQELLDWLDGEGGEGSRSLVWPLLRQSTVLTVCAHGQSLMDDLREVAAAAVDRAATLTSSTGVTSFQGLVVVGVPALRRVLSPALASRLAVGPGRCHGVAADAYARGAALVVQRGEVRAEADLAAAPHALGVLGLGENGAPMVRPLIQAGQSLPAAAHFTIVADRDAQKQVSVTLTRQGAAADEGHRYEFGPLVGSGVQRIGVSVEWRRDGGIDVRAVDRETGIPVECLDCLELAAGTPLAAVRHLRIG